MDLFGNNYTDDTAAASVSAEIARSKKKARSDLLICVAILVAFFLFNLFSGSKTVTLVTGQDTFGVITPDGETVTYAYTDVESMELGTDLGSFARGDMVHGRETKTCWSGTYKNVEFGEYQLHVDPRLDYYILTRLKDGGVFVFNYESNDTTQQLCEQLRQMLEQ